MMTILKRALTFSAAREMGLVHSDYSLRALPEEFTATVEYKVWGKSMNLLLYVVADDGQKYLLSFFRNRSNKKYSPRNLPDLDLSDVNIQPGKRIKFFTKTGNKGNVSVTRAELLA
jgi:hypothetical protein